VPSPARRTNSAAVSVRSSRRAVLAGSPDSRAHSVSDSGEDRQTTASSSSARSTVRAVVAIGTAVEPGGAAEAGTTVEASRVAEVGAAE